MKKYMNFILFTIGFILICFGLLLMSSSCSDKKDKITEPSEIFSVASSQLIGPLKTLVVLEIEGDNSIPQPASYYDAILTEANYNIRNWSHGQAWIEWQVVGWYRTPWGLCNTVGNWKNYIDPSINLDEWPIKCLILVGSGCSANSAPVSNGTGSFSVKPGVGPGTFLHEFLHVCGLGHANKCMNWPSCSTVYDYLDTCSVVSGNTANPRIHPPVALHLDKLGWITPTIISGSPGQTITIPLNLYETTGDAAKVQKNATEWYYVERRGFGLHVTTVEPNRTAGSMWIPSNITDSNGISIHEISGGARITLGDPDIINPTGVWVTPEVNAVVSGIVTLSVTPSDDRGISKIMYNSTTTPAWSVTVSSPPWSATKDTRTLPDGRQFVQAVIYDTGGNKTGLPGRRFFIQNTTPSPTLSIIPNVLVCPDGSLEYKVTINSDTGPMSGVTVELDFTGVSLFWCLSQIHPKITAITSTTGEAKFNIKAGGCITTQSVQVKVNNTLLKSVGVVSPDRNGNGTVDLLDLIEHSKYLKTGIYSFCSDFNSDGQCDLLDQTILTSTAKIGAKCS